MESSEIFKDPKGRQEKKKYKNRNQRKEIKRSVFALST